MALALLLLALGPILRLNGRLYDGVPTLYRMLEPLFLFRLIRVPERFNIVLALPLAVMAAYGDILVSIDRVSKAMELRGWF